VSLRALIAVVPIPFLLAAAAIAQTEDPALEPGEERLDLQLEEPRPWRFSIAPRYEYHFEAEVDEDIDVSISRAAIAFSAFKPINERLTFRTGFEYELSDYNFTGNPAFLEGQDASFDTAHQLAFTPALKYRVNDRWSIDATGIVELGFESGADVGDSIAGGGLFFGTYRVNDRLDLSFGLGVLTRLEDDPYVIPLPGVSWRPTERITLFTRGPGLFLETKATETLAFTVGAAWRPREYRLDENDGALSEGVLSDERVLATLRATWTPRPNIDVSFTLGGSVYQNFEVFDSGGDELADEETDPALFLAVEATIRF